MYYNRRMDRKQGLIGKIMDIEWEMFSSVQNRGGRASCQEDPGTFGIIRISNFQTWSESALESYLDDLEEARDAGRNLMTEKYARMEGIIPTLNPEVLPLIDQIVQRECRWVEELLEKYPDVKMARPIYSSQDTPLAVSSETYSRGELETYSKRTLELYHQDNLDMESQGLSRIEMSVRNMAKKFSERAQNDTERPQGSCTS
jgi:hypothetical protein